MDQQDQEDLKEIKDTPGLQGYWVYREVVVCLELLVDRKSVV